MSKKPHKAAASSSRVALGNPSTAFASSFVASSSPLSYLTEQPDLSALSDANLVVSFKNLSKKDSITKAKALEDIHEYVSKQNSAKTQIEESVFDTWVKFYPRVSIDVSRRVRHLSHAVHGDLFLAGGKRAAKYMTEVVGAWISGLYDGDRTVMRAADEAFKLVFKTEDRREEVKKIYQHSIVTFCADALLRETPKTLSDERSTTTDDAEAKFHRLISSCLGVLAHLLDTLPDDLIEKERQIYDEILESSTVWGLVSSPDSSIRRAIFKVSKICLVRQQDIVAANIKTIARAFRSKRVPRTQSGSSNQFMEALSMLSKLFPSVWSYNASHKVESLDFIQDVGERGSQGGSSEFWGNFATLFQYLPDDVLPRELDQAENVLRSLHSGIIRKDEPRANGDDAWYCYLTACDQLTKRLGREHQQELNASFRFPIVRQYVFPTQEDHDWAVTGSQPMKTVAASLQSEDVLSTAESEWDNLAEKLLQSIKTSAPEQSKDFESSQSSISSRGSRWFGFQSQVQKLDLPDSFKSKIASSNKSIVDGSLMLLKNREGKPFGAAAVVEAALRSIERTVLDQDGTLDIITNFTTESLPDLLLSPSRKHLVAILYLAASESCFEKAWNESMQKILETQDDEQRLATLSLLLGSVDIPDHFDFPASNSGLQAYLRNRVILALQGSDDWTFLAVALRSPAKVLTAETFEIIITKILEGTSTESEQMRALRGLKTIETNGKSQLKNYVVSGHELNPLTIALRLTESPNDEIAQMATELSTSLESQISGGSAEGAQQSSVVHILRDSLHTATQDSLSVETLLDLARKILKKSEELDREIALAVLPDAETWSLALSSFFYGSYPTALAITNSLGGVAYLITENSSVQGSKNLTVDADGLSAGLRMALYTTALSREFDMFGLLESKIQQSIYLNLLLVVQLINDKLSLVSANDLWEERDLTIEYDMLSFVSDAQILFVEWARPQPSLSEKKSAPTQQSIEDAQKQLLIDARGQSLIAFHSARAFCSSATDTLEKYGWPRLTNKQLEEEFREIRKNGGVNATAAFIAAFRPLLANTAGFVRFCNELVATLTGVELEKDPEGALRSLVLLNIMTSEDSPCLDSVSQHRMIFFIKHIVSWPGKDTKDLAIKAETFKVLSASLHTIQDIYGDHWTTIITSLVDFWSSLSQADLNDNTDNTLPLVHSSLRLFSSLRNLALDDNANEDLQEAWPLSIDSMAEGLIHLLKQTGALPDENNQPLRIVNELLGRQIGTVPLEKLQNTADLYPLLFVDSFTVQRTAYSILHKQIPAAQEQISIDVALDKTSARLPEELLSLILEAPTLDSLADESFDRNMPLPLRSYLSSWILIFDHFKNASDKVKSDYAEHIKEGDYLNSLLNFVFAFLGHATGKPVDASKFEITTYSFDIEDNPVRDIQWLLIHLYYLCLKRMPSLTKSWWIECKSRLLVQSVDTWTEKYISPPLITDTMSAVSDWVHIQDKAEDDALSIKTNPRSKEITVSREVDEQTLAMSIRLPPNYPLGQPVVEGINRVAVSEKKWQSWLLNTQGVITFSNNSITDGIIAFKRNVNGALKGQTECAICYSIVSSDKQLPTKKCTTCNNLFHGVCLYRWFQSSNSATCPLCRNPFSYHGRDIHQRPEY